MSFRVQYRGRTGCIVYHAWTRHGEEALPTLEEAVVVARAFADACHFAVRVAGDDGSIVSVARQRPSPSLAGPA